MTENKRFTLTKGFDEHERQIRDNGKIIMGCFHEVQAKPIVVLLNELNDENKQLKQQNKGLRETIERQNDWEKKAITEIEQLKQQIQQLKQWNKCLAEKRHNELKGDVE